MRKLKNEPITPRAKSTPVTSAVSEINVPTERAALPQTGFSRWDQLGPFLPIKRETWRKLGLAGRAPKPIRIGPRITVWDNALVHKWLANPEGYGSAA
jgi:predicted DNA-binding transcriptional regulator AlpA